MHFELLANALPYVFAHCVHMHVNVCSCAFCIVATCLSFWIIAGSTSSQSYIDYKSEVCEHHHPYSLLWFEVGPFFYNYGDILQHTIDNSVLPFLCQQFGEGPCDTATMVRGKVYSISIRCFFILKTLARLNFWCTLSLSPMHLLVCHT